jgi:hypothetical protein
MMQSVRGIYRSGVVELLEEPAGVAVAEVVVTFLSGGSGLDQTDEADSSDSSDSSERAAFAEDAAPLDDFEPVVPIKPVLLSDMVLEDRR